MLSHIKCSRGTALKNSRNDAEFSASFSGLPAEDFRVVPRFTAIYELAAL
jgi:hypothetical protein